MPKVSDEHRLARRNEIADAALRCFAVKGFQGSSMADIIQESGLSAGAIYGHFGSKREIMFAVAERVLAARAADVAKSLAADVLPSPGTVVRQTITGVTDDLHGPQLLLQLWGEATTDPDLRHYSGRMFQQLQVRWTTYLTAWAASGGRLTAEESAAWGERMTPALISLVQGYYAQTTLLDSFTPDNYFTTIDELFPRP